MLGTQWASTNHQNLPFWLAGLCAFDEVANFSQSQPTPRATKVATTDNLCASRNLDI
jgi:hypothetical protein